MPTLEPEASYIEKYGALPSHAEIEAYRVELRERFDIDFDLEWKTYWLERASNDPAVDILERLYIFWSEIRTKLKE